jgi:hypothetical protein
MNNNQNGNYGTLIVAVRTARGAFPVAGAIVTVSEVPPKPSDGAAPDAVATRMSNISGIAGPFRLPAPPPSLSMIPPSGPDSPLQFAIYSVSVSHDGYYPYESPSEPIFSGVTSYMEINLIPLAEYDTIDSEPPAMRT